MNKRLGLAAAAVLAAMGGGALAISRLDAPPAAEKLGEAQEAGRAAQDLSARIAADLEEIAANLQAGADIPQQSGEIHDLTEKQRESLEQLVSLLKEQLEAVEASTEQVKKTRSAAEDLAELSAAQTELLRRAVAALRNLRELAATAGAMSADLARAAVYGARLAEDSARSFSDP